MRKQDVAKRNFYDVWLPELAPSAALLAWVASEPLTDRRWKIFARRYGIEMGRPAAARLLRLLAALSVQTDFSVGCYCADATRCHRSLLGGLLEQHGASMA